MIYTSVINNSYCYVDRTYVTKLYYLCVKNLLQWPKVLIVFSEKHAARFSSATFMVRRAIFIVLQIDINHTY